MKKILSFVFFVFLFASCSTYEEISYFQDLENTITGELTSGESPLSLTIRPDDELLIIVSAADPAVAAPFNLPMVSTQSPSSISGEMAGSKSAQKSGGSSAMQTYLVNSEGIIHFPGLGKIKVEGMTKDALTKHLEDLLKKHIEDPIVNIQIVNFKISVLGEVNAPGSYGFSHQRVSILEALASAQDMTIHGKRENVFVARNINGKIEYYKMDLTKSDIFQSPYYYLQQNDIVYVVPNKEKQRDSKSGEQKSYNTSIIISAISTVISVIAIVAR